MAEGFFKALAPPGMTVESAGTNPIGLHPRAVATMAEAGIDISGHHSKGIDPSMYPRATRIVTVCSHAAQRCPAPPPGLPREHWPIDDPAAVGSEGEEAVRTSFRRTRDEIRGRIEGLLRRLHEGAP
jgi:arsenate reductase